jgi:hypothetical protein
LRALYVFPLWFLQQLLASRFEASGQGDQVAYSAHVGGLLFGVAIALLLRWSGHDARQAAEPASEEKLEESSIESTDDLPALELLARTNPADAAMRLRRLVARNPHLIDAKLALCRLAVQTGEFTSLRVFLPQTLSALCRDGRTADALDLFRAVQAGWPTFDIGEEPLAALVHAARSGPDRLFSVQLADRFLREHPNSRHVPATLWGLAEEYERGGRPDYARHVLSRLATDHPLDRHGRMARDRLQNLAQSENAAYEAVNSAPAAQSPPGVGYDPFTTDDSPPLELERDPRKRR